MVLQEDIRGVKKSLALAVDEAAEELSLTERALRQWIWRGKIPVRRLGKRVLILRSDLERFLNELPSE
jgi:excisionase family DNA binding protein